MARWRGQAALISDKGLRERADNIVHCEAGRRVPDRGTGVHFSHPTQVLQECTIGGVRIGLEQDTQHHNAIGILGSGAHVAVFHIPVHDMHFHFAWLGVDVMLGALILLGAPVEVQLLEHVHGSQGTTGEHRTMARVLEAKLHRMSIIFHDHVLGLQVRLHVPQGSQGGGAQAIVSH